ncbi:hypothetical protein GCM10010483_65520 [Actinokineospora diospyrosa]
MPSPATPTQPGNPAAPTHHRFAPARGTGAQPPPSPGGGPGASLPGPADSGSWEKAAKIYMWITSVAQSGELAARGRGRRGRGKRREEVGIKGKSGRERSGGLLADVFEPEVRVLGDESGHHPHAFGVVEDRHAHAVVG